MLRNVPFSILRRPFGAALLGGVVLMAACTTPPPAPPPQPEPAPVPALAPVPEPPPPPAPPDVDSTEAADAASRDLLAFHDRIRPLPPNELAQEISRLNAQVSANAAAASPALVLELALALAQQRNGGDLGRAIALLDPVTRSSAPELKPWQPMARLLQARFTDQRRIEEQVERQGNQLRDSQRNVQQLNEKLEALKAIERSLTTRPPAPPSTAPAASTPARP